MYRRVQTPVGTPCQYDLPNRLGTTIAAVAEGVKNQLVVDPHGMSRSDDRPRIRACRMGADRADATVSVTVLDAGGHLLAFRRDDNAVLISGETSTRKAYTAAQPVPHRTAPTAHADADLPVVR